MGVALEYGLRSFAKKEDSMPKAKDIGLGKHLSDWEKRKKQERERERKEQGRKAEIKRHKEKAALYTAKTKEKKAKAGMRKASHGRRKTAGRGVKLSQFFK